MIYPLGSCAHILSFSLTARESLIYYNILIIRFWLKCRQWRLIVLVRCDFLVVERDLLVVGFFVLLNIRDGLVTKHNFKLIMRSGNPIDPWQIYLCRILETKSYMYTIKCYLMISYVIYCPVTMIYFESRMIAMTFPSYFMMKPCRWDFKRTYFTFWNVHLLCLNDHHPIMIFRTSHLHRS